MATAAAELAPESGFVFDGVTWADYEAMLRIVGNRPIRINYDSGRMEIVSPLFRHGNGPFLLGQMIVVLAEELEIDYEAASYVTFRRRDREKGIEPDGCFFIGDNAERVRGKRRLDMTIDPPPDLVIEADLTSSSIPRFPIFAALAIPEVWRLDEDVLHFLQLQPDGTYQPAVRSLAFPILQLVDAARFYEQGLGMNKVVWARGFRDVIRQIVPPRDPD